MTAEPVEEVAEVPKPRKIPEPSHVAKMALQANSDSKRWFPNTANDIGFTALCLAGETGEVANEVKKVVRGTADMGDAATRLAIWMELADVFTYLLDLSAMVGCDLEKAYYAKRAHNEKRFGPKLPEGKN